MRPETTAQYYRCPLSKYFFISGTEMYYGDRILNRKYWKFRYF